MFIVNFTFEATPGFNSIMLVIINMMSVTMTRVIVLQRVAGMLEISDSMVQRQMDRDQFRNVSNFDLVEPD